LLKVVAVVDRNDEQTKQLLDHIKAENFQIDINDSFDRDISEDADVGAYIAIDSRASITKSRACSKNAWTLASSFTPMWFASDVRLTF